jgi:pilus assembly protein Flp/PilA
MKRALRTLTDRRQRGQCLVEYALILVLVAVVVVTVLTTLGTRITAVFTNVSKALGWVAARRGTRRADRAEGWA